MRTFTSKHATREPVPLLIGLVGPSSSGKTFSALRLATGIREMNRKPIYVIDTETRRALHYADRFDFEHVEFNAPFGPLDYMAAVEHCASAGAGTIIIDSASHWHEGPGGILEMHDAELDRIAGKTDEGNRMKNSARAWAKPKAELRRLLIGIVQTGCSMILCFRAKEKLKFGKGQPQELGWMPIASDEALYEMTASFILPPSCGGVPDWNPAREGERRMMKIPAQFEWLRGVQEPLDEVAGRRMAEWAAGDAAPVAVAPAATPGPEPTPLPEGRRDWSADIRDAQSMAELDAVAGDLRTATDRGDLKATQIRKLKTEWGRRRDALAAQDFALQGQREPGDDDPDQGAA